MKMEIIPPNTIIPHLQKRLKQLKEALAELEQAKKNQPRGHLRVAQKSDSRPQYYHYTSPDDFTGKYIRKKNIDFAKILAQKDYNENIIPLIQKEIISIEEYLLYTENGKSFPSLYTRLCPPRRSLSIVARIIQQSLYIPIFSVLIHAPVKKSSGNTLVAWTIPSTQQMQPESFACIQKMEYFRAVISS